jgi:hypothetical protein
MRVRYEAFTYNQGDTLEKLGDKRTGTIEIPLKSFDFTAAQAIANAYIGIETGKKVLSKYTKVQEVKE